MLVYKSVACKYSALSPSLLLHRCSVFLFDRECGDLVAKVFDGGLTSGKEMTIRLSKGQGIAGLVGQTGGVSISTYFNSKVYVT